MPGLRRGLTLVKPGELVVGIFPVATCRLEKLVGKNSMEKKAALRNKVYLYFDISHLKTTNIIVIFSGKRFIVE